MSKRRSVKSTKHSDTRVNQNTKHECFVCAKEVNEIKDENRIEDQIICDSCRDQMFSSLEGSWKKYSAFLDSALN